MTAFFDYRPEYRLHAQEIGEAIQRVLESGQLILGDEVQRFETEFSSYIGVRGGVGVGTGTDAILLALRALDIGAGDEVITVSNAGVPPVAAIRLCGAEPVFADVCADSLTLDPDAVLAALSERTKAIVVVHLYGNVADLDRLTAIASERGVALIEDCAQSSGATLHGRRVGSFGTFGCFSFYPTKNLGAFGDGGAVVSNDDALLERVRQLRMYGYRSGCRVALLEGDNSRLDEMQAAILRVKLRYLDKTNAERQRLAGRYETILKRSSLQRVQLRQEAKHVYHLYVVRSAERDSFRALCEQHEFPTSMHYADAVDEMEPYRRFRVGASGLENARRACDEVVSLPLYVGMPESLFDRFETMVGAMAR
jgi:dTDP-4-amino-4,6-dideoxygalactose transaminase